MSDTGAPPDRSPAPADRLIAALEAEGRLVDHGEFTLDGQVAKATLRHHQLADPRGYVLELVQAAVAAGAGAVAIAIDADDVRLRFDGRGFGLVALEGLWPALLAGTAGPDRALMQLALGLNAALRLAPKRVRVTSRCADGHGAQLELRPGHDDRLEPLPSGPDSLAPGTTVHVASRLHPRLIRRVWQDLRGTIPEEVLLRARCRFARAEVSLDGERISGAPFAPLGGAVPLALPEGLGLTGRAGYDPGVAAGQAVLRIVKDGVLVTTRHLDLAPGGLSALVYADGLRKDLSQGDVVEDEVWAALLGCLDATAAAAREALLERYGGLQGRATLSWAARILRDGVRWLGAPAEVLEAPAGSPARRWGELPLFRLTAFNASARVDDPITGLWGEGDTLFAVCWDGIIVRFDGRVPVHLPAPTSVDLRAVWGAARDDVFVVGDEGTLLRWDGVAWSPMLHDVAERLTAVAGTGPTNVFAAGVGSTLIHFDGATWRRRECEGNYWEGLWCASETRLYLAGSDGLARLEGDVGELVVRTPDGWLRAVWGCGPDEVFAVGDDGVIVHYVGGEYELMESGTSAQLWSVHGRGPDDVFVTGRGVVLHYDGRRWRDITPPGVEHYVKAVSVLSATHVAIGGILRGDVMIWDGAGWSRHPLRGQGPEADAEALPRDVSFAELCDRAQEDGPPPVGVRGKPEPSGVYVELDTAAQAERLRRLLSAANPVDS